VSSGISCDKHDLHRAVACGYCLAEHKRKLVAAQGKITRTRRLIIAAAQRLERFNVFGCDHDACSNADECDVVTELIDKLRKEVQGCAKMI